ncbi:MAG: NAD-glutamate dehydrogenase [Dermatophilaceae bacterium]
MPQHEAARRERLEDAARRGQAKGGPPLSDFLTAYYRHVPAEEILARSADDLLSMALAHRDLARSRPVGTATVTCVNPSIESEGWSSPHSVVQIVTDDRPFLVDSVTAHLEMVDRPIHAVIHPVMVVRRSADGQLEDLVLDEDQSVPESVASHSYGELRESWIHLEISRESDDAARRALVSGLTKVLSDVREAVEDWPKMRARAQALADDLRAHSPKGIPGSEAIQAADFLDWMVANNFTFLGARDYSLVPGKGGAHLTTASGSGLGLLRSDPAMARQLTTLSGTALDKALERRVLFITKANSRATVHRAVYLDYIGIRRFDGDGAVIGEHRFLGLFTASAYADSVLRIPYVKDKVADVMAASGFPAESHSGKDLLGILENYPRDEVFQASTAQLLDVASQVVHLKEKRRCRLFCRLDDFGRFVSALVFIPRDRYNTAVRHRMEAILAEAYGATSVDFTTRVSESALAQVHFVLRLPAKSHRLAVDAAALESKIADATRTWDEDLVDAAIRELGEEATARVAGLYGRAFPTSYKEDFSVKQGIADIRHLDALGDADATALVLYKPRWNPETIRRFKLFRRAPLSLTQVLPLFTHMGVEVVDERPYALTRRDGQEQYVYDFGLRVKDDTLWTSMTHARLRELFESAVDAVWHGHAESDGFNALVLRAQLTWRQIVILRAIAKYLRQTRSAFSQSYVEAALLHNWQIATQLVALFEARFDPERPDEARDAEQDRLAAQITEALDDVASLDEDRIIRAFLGVIRATLRTNYYQRDAAGQSKDYLSVKLDPRIVPDLPAPRPAFEIWVYSPRVEGVHLRFGPVARGGLRWSDRREDFRTEILGLVKAQMVKNAVIVPTGSKGGFYPKQLPEDAAGKREEGIAAYRIFISGLLDLTDNRVGEDIVAPERTVRHDGDDPYLVVAADKGTATFSDIANAVSQDYRFWLDDAFASGGSSGYDHKAMGITARGAWESVKRHFREMGLDTQTEDFTVVGVGDMSGDVFGNGMLLSEHIRLVAAFDHRHVFVDPDPDPAVSYAERRRLFDLPGSSWASYDSALISEGGGVWARSLKAIPVSAPMRAVLGLADDVTTMTPNDLIHAILLAPVDLLWNGGIGTYVKAAEETNDDVGDRANDAIRVDGGHLRVRVVGEGGNLGLSQRGRIEAALAGVRVNTDAIDNSAGVDTSDHEVNIKILLREVVRQEDLTLKQRNTLLASMTDEVAAQVLRDNYEQNVLLGNARAQQFDMLDVHTRLIHWLEERGDLDRELEHLPSDIALAERAEAGRGLTSPEFAVLVAYAKLALKHDLLPTGLPDDPWFQQTLRRYFPGPIQDGFAEAIATHPLRREIITNAVANSLVNRGGITFVYRAMEETGAGAEQIARAFVIAREVFALPDFVTAVEALDNVVPASTQTRLYLEFRRLLDRSARWFLANRPVGLDVAGELDRYAAVVRDWSPRLADLLVGSEGERLRSSARRYSEDGVPESLALATAGLLDAFSLLDCTDLCASTGESPDEVIPLYFRVSECFGVDALLHRITSLPRGDRWDALARGALRDDLYGVLKALTHNVLEATDAGAPPQVRVETWTETNRENLARARRALAGIERLEKPTIAAMSVALRTLRSVVRAG